MALSQDGRMITITTPLGKDVLIVEGFAGEEQVGRPFLYKIDLVSEDGEIDPKKLLGQSITLTVSCSDGRKRYVHGHVTSFQTHFETSFRFFRYELELRPWNWFLSKTTDCQIFQEMSVPDIIKDIFRQHGFSDFEDQLTENYSEMVYCVQYNETDLDFVQRLMEQEGIYYFYTHTADKHSLVMCDSPNVHAETPGYEKIPYIPHDPTRSSYLESIGFWGVAHSITPSSVVLTDYNFETPKQDLLSPSGKQTKSHAHDDYEQFAFPGVHGTPAEGERYAKIRLEEAQVEFEKFDARGNVAGITPGAKFKLTDHPVAKNNKNYLLLGASLRLTNGGVIPGSGQDDQIDVGFIVIDATTPFRLPRSTPKPIVKGPQTAVVTGQSGEEIHPDKYGRVKVKFFWDRYNPYNETSSCWIRVAHPIAGKRWGAHHLPRIGQEVIVEFLEGNPDRPIITGSVYNAETMPPYDLPGNKTRSGIKTNSSKGGQGYNEFRIEDKKGEEQIYMHAERQLDIRVKEDRLEFIALNAVSWSSSCARRRPRCRKAARSDRRSRRSACPTRRIPRDPSALRRAPDLRNIKTKPPYPVRTTLRQLSG
ncbi:MAG: type VI secretion system tip protein VgrG [Pseudomonadota bacterium]